MLYSSGLAELEIGIESGSERILKLMNKQIHPKQVIKVVKKSLQREIKVKGFLMVGYPTETEKDLLKTISLVKKLKRMAGKKIRFSPVIVKPYRGTRLWKEWKDKIIGCTYKNIDISKTEDPLMIKKALKKRIRYNAVLVDRKGEPFILSEYSKGASSKKVIEALREIVLISKELK